MERNYMNVTRGASRFALFVILITAWLGTVHAATLPFTTGLQLWLDSTQGVTTVGSTVTGWADQSGNGHDGSYTSGAPQLVSSAINGLPAISFNGAGDYFALANGQVLPSDQFTVFAVATDTGASIGGDREIYSNWDGLNSWSSEFLGTSDGSGTDRSGRLTDGLVVSGAVSNPSTPFIMSGVYTGGVNADLLVNGVLAGSNPQNNLPADVSNPNGQRDLTTPSFIGEQGSFPGEYWQGLIGEVLVYNGALTAEQQTEVYDYLQAKWVPEPSSLALLGIGAFASLVIARQRTRKASRLA
jgi:PEP-CTERM motif